MQLSIHGTERIQARTRMMLKDVLTILNAGACIPLGSGLGGEFEYLAFYSPPDQICKVAVVSRRRETLVSIWETRFTYPLGVQRVGSATKRKAREILYATLGTRVRFGEHTLRMLPCKLEVVVADAVIYAGVVGEIPAHASKDKARSLMKLLAEKVRLVMVVINEHAELIGEAPINYCFSIPDPIAKEVRHIRYTHLQLVRVVGE